MRCVAKESGRETHFEFIRASSPSTPRTACGVFASTTWKSREFRYQCFFAQLDVGERRRRTYWLSPSVAERKEEYESGEGRECRQRRSNHYCPRNKIKLDTHSEGRTRPTPRTTSYPGVVARSRSDTGDPSIVNERPNDAPCGTPSCISYTERSSPSF